MVVDESLTSGTTYWDVTEESLPFSHLALTGGAIGQGPPCAVGAAIACPGRRVINLQADGSGLYTAQALWTQAHEKLNVTTVVCANNTYNILKLELKKQKPGGRHPGFEPNTQPRSTIWDDVPPPRMKPHSSPKLGTATTSEFHKPRS